MMRHSDITTTLGNVTTFTYTGQTKTESVLSFNAGATVVDMLTTSASLGRQFLLQTRQAPVLPTLIQSRHFMTHSVDKRAKASLTPELQVKRPLPAPRLKQPFDGVDLALGKRLISAQHCDSGNRTARLGSEIGNGCAVGIR
jgi:hypothetical protein